ncbi:GIY-YIG nuclease family protein [Nocardioides aquaticus]|uniref:GIY-YIG nuclease family protein n=2 Tax=Nocardioides aquaticus TaxID=160826 RepID=UPI001BD61707|nr:GIY-YIG nuclease family protein [Nocardioides aquaticus]
MIYAYTVPGRKDQAWDRTVGQMHTTGTGLIKVGETTKPTAFERIKQQLNTAYPGLRGVDILLEEEAKRSDGSWFGDRDVHRALVTQGISKEQEWFEATLDEVKAALVAVRNGTAYESQRTQDFPMRPEQEDAVAQTAGYFLSQGGGTHAPKVLWNAKMRFGKTFTAYQLAREMGFKRTLVLTYKPAVQSAWRDDLLGHVDFEGWHFVDRTTPVNVADELADGADPLVWFASFQDITGKAAGGGIKERNETLHYIEWDCIVLDEYHFGAWRDGARDLYDPTEKELAEVEEPDDWVTEEDLGLNSKHYLYLSGTPFRAITNGEFTEDAVFNWTYVDEQNAKAHWDDADGQNPYVDLPGMKMYAYEIGAPATEWANDGEFNGFSLTEYFKAQKADPESKSKKVERGTYTFNDETRVKDFLEMLRGKLTEQMKVQLLGVSGKKAPFPYESADFRDAIQHSVWYMADVGSCFAMRDILEAHPYFNGFEIHVAAGAGAGMGAEAKPPVEKAIKKARDQRLSGSITLSCGKLMTGVTIREWGAILMLRSLKSPESYFQSAFRVQSPWSYRTAGGSIDVQKDTVYVFEFDPNRALTLVAEYGMKLATTGETTPQQAIGDLMNYLPIFQFSGGQMRQLDAADVLNIATTGVGASALAARWNSPVLVDVNEHTLSALLEHPDLLEALEQIEDFRNLANMAQQVVTSTKKLKKVEREKGKNNLDDDEKTERKESNSARKQIREKLQKFLAKIPVFMYVTDFREESLKDVIESLDSELFTRVTGLTVKDFRLLNRLGLFNAQHMNAAIYQFKSFENASLHYADEAVPDGTGTKVGLWDKRIDASQLGLGYDDLADTTEQPTTEDPDAGAPAGPKQASPTDWLRAKARATN